MGKIIFILGGARSGKSRYALKLALESGAGKVAFVATCEPLDKEMRARIALHQKARPKHWQVFEAPRELSVILKKIDAGFEFILIDCLTLFVSNLLLKKSKKEELEDEIEKTLSMLKKTHATSVIVSNEVGLGIVPKNKLTRDFRDIAGSVNQMVADGASEVFFMVSGIPWRVK